MSIAAYDTKQSWIGMATKNIKKSNFAREALVINAHKACQPMGRCSVPWE
jgi:hypothetical protein